MPETTRTRRSRLSRPGPGVVAGVGPVGRAVARSAGPPLGERRVTTP